MPTSPSRFAKRIIGAFALSAALLTAGCNTPGAEDASVLHVGSQRGGTKAVMIASGVLDGAPYKVEWAEFAAAQPLLEAIGAGAVDLGVAGDAPFIFAYESGSPIKAVGLQLAQNRPAGALALIVPGGSAARSLAELKGRKIATTRGSIGHYLILRALQDAKLPADWLTITFLSPGDARAAFSSGAVDGWATWTPYLQPAFKEGARTIIDGRDLTRGYGFDVASDAAIKGKAALLTDFLDREAKALEWARRNPDRYAAVLSKETGLPADAARDYAAKSGRTATAIDDEVVAYLQSVITLFGHAGAAKAHRPVADAFDRSIAPAPAGPTN